MCSNSEQCPLGGFCNFDDGSGGFCEFCSDIGDCLTEGFISPKGNTECAMRCNQGMFKCQKIAGTFNSTLNCYVYPKIITHSNKKQNSDLVDCTMSQWTQWTECAKQNCTNVLFGQVYLASCYRHSWIRYILTQATENGECKNIKEEQKTCTPGMHQFVSDC